MTFQEVINHITNMEFTRLCGFIIGALLSIWAGNQLFKFATTGNMRHFAAMIIMFIIGSNLLGHTW
jgi:hypothetical protein